jgi:N-carbamoylputrescine amidase
MVEFTCSGAPSIQRDTPFKIGLVQMSCSSDPDSNLQKAIDGVREAAARGAEIVCLQELFRSQYFCREENAELFNLAETVPGPSTEALASKARARFVSQHGSSAGRRRFVDWPVSQDAHS